MRGTVRPVSSEWLTHGNSWGGPACYGPGEMEEFSNWNFTHRVNTCGHFLWALMEAEPKSSDQWHTMYSMVDSWHKGTLEHY